MSPETPAPPCIWIALSSTLHHIVGTAALIMAISLRTRVITNFISAFVDSTSPPCPAVYRLKACCLLMIHVNDGCAVEHEKFLLSHVEATLSYHLVVA